MKFLLLTIFGNSLVLVASSRPEYYFVESESNETANGCYKKTNKLNPQDHSPEFKLPIYKKTSPPVLYMMVKQYQQYAMDNY